MSIVFIFSLERLNLFFLVTRKSPQLFFIWFLFFDIHSRFKYFRHKPLFWLIFDILLLFIPHFFSFFLYFRKFFWLIFFFFWCLLICIWWDNLIFDLILIFFNFIFLLSFLSFFLFIFIEMINQIIYMYKISFRLPSPIFRIIKIFPMNKVLSTFNSFSLNNR